jgi:hypothetical protein
MHRNRLFALLVFWAEVWPVHPAPVIPINDGLCNVAAAPRIIRPSRDVQNKIFERDIYAFRSGLTGRLSLHLIESRFGAWCLVFEQFHHEIERTQQSIVIFREGDCSSTESPSGSVVQYNALECRYLVGLDTKEVPHDNFAVMAPIQKVAVERIERGNLWLQIGRPSISGALQRTIALLEGEPCRCESIERGSSLIFVGNDPFRDESGPSPQLEHLALIIGEHASPVRKIHSATAVDRKRNKIVRDVNGKIGAMGHSREPRCGEAFASEQQVVVAWRLRRTPLKRRRRAAAPDQAQPRCFCLNYNFLTVRKWTILRTVELAEARKTMANSHLKMVDPTTVNRTVVVLL